MSALKGFSRKFNGKTFTASGGIGNTKRDALKIKKKFKKIGHLARIVKTSGGWSGKGNRGYTVYTRVGKKH